MFSNVEHDIQLQPTPVWVHLTYQTAFVDNAGKLQMRRDVYNLDSRTLAAIKSDRGLVEPAAERKEEIATRSAPRRAVRPAAPTSPVFQSTSYQTPGYARPLAFQPIYR
jgi:hypothetical protein